MLLVASPPSRTARHCSSRTVCRRSRAMCRRHHGRERELSRPEEVGGMEASVPEKGEGVRLAHDEGDGRGE